MQTRVSQAPEDYLFNLGKGIADFAGIFEN
jgi:hypothetical protein